MSLIGQTIHGNLKILSLIGEGAMGAVFLAENVDLPERKCAVKVLLREITDTSMFQERFNEEARNQAGLDHPNIVTVHDYFREHGRYFLVMDYVEGESLQKIIRARDKLSEQRAVEIMDDVLRGLDCAHRHGIVHRDVKPSNILVDRSGRARLTDFGIAIRAGDLRLTATGAAAVGTAAYMSPEQIRTPTQIDHRADVYASGIVLFEMLTGTVPFRGETEFAVYQQQVKSAPPNPRTLNGSISKRVARIVLLALAKDPAQRVQGCEVLRRLLIGELAPPVRWKPLAWIAAAAVLGAALYGSAPHWQPSLSRLLAAGPAIDPGEVRDLALAAVQAHELLCRESAMKESKEAGKRLAEQIPDTSKAEEFERQIKEADQNIADLTRAYNLNVTRLAKYAERIVAQATQSAAADSTRAAYVGALTRDTQQVRAAPHEIDAPGLLQSCPGGTLKNP